MPKEPPHEPLRKPFHEGPFEARKRIAESQSLIRVRAEEKKRQNVMKQNKERHAKKGGFRAFDPRLEKGIFLKLFKKNGPGKLQRVALPSAGTSGIKILDEAAENLRNEMKYYGKFISSKFLQFELFDQKNLYVLIDKFDKHRIVKTVVEAFPTLRRTEVTYYYLDLTNNVLVVENVVSPWPKK